MRDCPVCGSPMVFQARYVSWLLEGLSLYRCPAGCGARVVEERREPIPLGPRSGRKEVRGTI